MPEMDGIELTKALQEVYPEIKIIGLTMYEEDYLVVDMLEAGGRGYLMKNSGTNKLIERPYRWCMRMGVISARVLR